MSKTVEIKIPVCRMHEEFIQRDETEEFETVFEDDESVIGHWEVVDFLTQSEEAKAQLAAKRIPFDESVQRGMMIETPAAALIADELLAMVDFASLGTNDLTQYTLAVDRGNEHIASLYDARHPAVVNLIKTAAEAGRRLEKPIGICGELASDEMMIPILLECGLNSLSMVPARIPDAKRRIAEL